MYNFEEARVREFLRQQRVKRAAIQLPAGLRPHITEITAAFEKEGVEGIVLADSCYGACDLADVKAKQLGCDALIHYGHADIGLPTCLPTLYVESRMKVDPSHVVKQVLPKLKFRRLGLVATVQHVGYLKRVGELLRTGGINAVVGEPGPMAKYPGQVLGCDWGSARSIADHVDGFLYIGTGEFHPLGVALATGKEVVTVNPIAMGFSRIDSKNVEDFLSRRRAMVSRATACERFGVIVSTKRGQARFGLAARVAEKLRRAGRAARVLVVDEVRPEELEDFGFDAFVCTACPRIPTDDAERFRHPILTQFEVKVMLNEAKFEPYQMDETKREDF